MSELKLFDNRIRRRERIERLGGIDEAGRGALAGPVVAAVVVLGPEAELEGVTDSKALTPEVREALAPKILATARDAALGLATAAEVDELNVLQATLLASRRALDRLRVPPQYLITDYLKIQSPPCPILAIAKGDATSLAVAAASVLAKVARDRIMRLLDAEYPFYGLAGHKGYGTAAHLAALERHGPSTAHRLTFKGVCFFDAEPSVHADSAERGVLPTRKPQADLLELLGEDAKSLRATAFLPDCEYRSAGVPAS